MRDFLTVIIAANYQTAHVVAERLDLGANWTTSLLMLAANPSSIVVVRGWEAGYTVDEVQDRKELITNQRIKEVCL